MQTARVRGQGPAGRPRLAGCRGASWEGGEPQGPRSWAPWAAQWGGQEDGWRLQAPAMGRGTHRRGPGLADAAPGSLHPLNAPAPGRKRKVRVHPEQSSSSSRTQQVPVVGVPQAGDPLQARDRRATRPWHRRSARQRPGRPAGATCPRALVRDPPPGRQAAALSRLDQPREKRGVMAPRVAFQRRDAERGDRFLVSRITAGACTCKYLFVQVMVAERRVNPTQSSLRLCLRTGTRGRCELT